MMKIKCIFTDRGGVRYQTSFSPEICRWKHYQLMDFVRPSLYNVALCVVTRFVVDTLHNELLCYCSHLRVAPVLG